MSRNLISLFLLKTLLLASISLNLAEAQELYDQILNTKTNSSAMFEQSPQIEVGRRPNSMAINLVEDKDGFMLYVTNEESNSVSVIDVENNIELAEVMVGLSPENIAINEETNKIYVSNGGSNTLSVIDSQNNSKIKDIDVGENPGNIAIDEDRNKIYVVNLNNISVINGRNDVAMHPIEAIGKDIVIEEQGNKIYVMNYADTVSVVNSTNGMKINEIEVGMGNLRDIAYSSLGNKIYVIHSQNVSVIDVENDSKIADIDLGGDPIQLAIDEGRKLTYVLHDRFGDISVISNDDNKKVGEFGEIVSNPSGSPNFMAINTETDMIYVGNSNTENWLAPGYVSVFNAINGSKMADITVGSDPSYIVIKEDANTIYTLNRLSNGISAIEGRTNRNIAGITLNTNSPNSGSIECDQLNTPLDQRIVVWAGTTCTALPNKGFEFSSWVEVLEGNLTRTINETSGSFWTSFLDAIYLKPNDPAANLTVNDFGNFTAYFRALPPPIPSEYLIPLYGIVVSTVVGLSIPSIITWRKTKKQTSRLNTYHRKMTSLYDDGRLDESDTEHLNLIKKNIINAYSEGKINNEQYTNLKEEISALYEEIYRKRLDALKDSSNEDVNRTVVIEKIQEDIKDAYSKSKISELHYNLLNEKITKMTSKNNSQE